MSSPAPDHTPVSSGFGALALHPDVQRVLADVGYESPSPIQAATIPPLLEGRDVLGQAQTGTGKTAAFALPILSRIERRPGKPQALVLAPTRELAIQVAEAFQTYAAHVPGFQVLPIYGGQSYGPQLHSLKRGVHVVVGTPGRVIDHLDKGTLDLSELKFLVLDEADEMLRMGFIDDVEKVLQATPPGRQVALFSATMPAPIRKIAQRHLKEPVEVTIKSSTTTAANIHQRYWFVSGMHKLDALTRILEAEPFDAMIIFARTKQATEELAEKLQARGLAAAAINGDIAQAQRERVIQQLKDGKLDILVATDVAARGLDVERISHVLNYDIPYDTESYVHRIGRTGRAGRSGEAILFVSPRERGMLHAIERATRQPIEQMQLPSVEVVNDVRIGKFKQRISDMLAQGELEQFQQLIEQYEQEHNVPAVEIAAALARIAQGDQPLLLTPPPKREKYEPAAREHKPREREGTPARVPREHKPRTHEPRPQEGAPPRESAQRPLRAHATEQGKRTYRIEVGHEHGVKPGNIIGAIANEAGLDSQYIGRLSIRDHYSLIDLPDGMPQEVFEHLKKVWVVQQQLRIHEWDGNDAGNGAPPAHKPGGFRKPAGVKPRPGAGKPPRRK
ncbi:MULTISPECIES: DEAD/DEAH box helicase [Rhodanobacter]|uniref:DEAD/DEAH box helicase n=1 Tax=Rhodanobacter TaxID=75309 RepID=UPI000486E416|nr:MULTISPECIES: DEAD/DEAH box helicase [Rhodanobacter]KZC19839.1 RNA helicase [Rhodanobacter denitrificans]UJJ52212.1 DEAD/DEAH box helicase [Rhodanobacter denitrificans]UJM94959.1 DEAD/DEAH box helicase [Rhodanobacter denitrificans]UJM98489.1 DEAD/DEAH box helicase [Rhodanobacter denitrificans]UJN22098.1 DEAD/DEAH box helicase [Rhodanobacter denitrificans]